MKKSLLFKTIAIVIAGVWLVMGTMRVIDKDSEFEAVEISEATEETHEPTKEIPTPTAYEVIGEVAEPEYEEVLLEANAMPPQEETRTSIRSMDWDCDESYLLAKIAMAEAGNQDTEGKALVILVVINRVWDSRFPGTIEEVIYQKNQFSPVANGSFDKAEPSEDCWEALEMVMQGWDESQGALYFESEGKSTWHRDNLKFLFKHQDHYFYTERD